MVVHDAFETMVKSDLYSVWLTPITNIGVLSFGGAEIITFFAPPLMWASHFTASVKTPVDSQT